MHFQVTVRLDENEFDIIREGFLHWRIIFNDDAPRTLVGSYEQKSVADIIRMTDKKTTAYSLQDVHQLIQIGSSLLYVLTDQQDRRVDPNWMVDTQEQQNRGEIPIIADPREFLEMLTETRRYQFQQTQEAIKMLNKLYMRLRSVNVVIDTWAIDDGQDVYAETMNIG